MINLYTTTAQAHLRLKFGAPPGQAPHIEATPSTTDTELNAFKEKLSKMSRQELIDLCIQNFQAVQRMEQIFLNGPQELRKDLEAIPGKTDKK